MDVYSERELKRRVARENAWTEAETDANIIITSTEAMFDLLFMDEGRTTEELQEDIRWLANLDIHGPEFKRNFYRSLAEYYVAGSNSTYKLNTGEWALVLEPWPVVDEQIVVEELWPNADA